MQRAFLPAAWVSVWALIPTSVIGLPRIQESNQEPPGSGRVIAGNNRGAVDGIVSQFERAYMRQDKNTMLMKLMIPTNDANALEKRYQWLRGYGPKDMPGTVHPPILFKTTKGSFVPQQYSLLKENPIDATHWSAVVKEIGTYHDEDGRYKVTRTRNFKVTKYKGKWYVEDYYLKENPEDYGFPVDDIVDKMTKIK